MKEPKKKIVPKKQVKRKPIIDDEEDNWDDR